MMYDIGVSHMYFQEVPSQSMRSPLGTISTAYPMQIMAFDLVGPLPVSESRNSYIMVAADYFFPLDGCISQIRRHQSQEKLVDGRFSAPAEPLHSDLGWQFESHLMSEVCKLLQIHKTRTTPYHSKSEGLVERFSRTMLAMLFTCVQDNRFDWESM